jgi:hypothetical protein
MKPELNYNNIAAKAFFAKHKTEQTKKSKSSKPELPKEGIRFMINGVNYRVCYVNKGQNRFSSEPCEGGY